MKKKKIYLRPAITCVAMDKEMLLAGTVDINISDKPADEEASSKGSSEIEFFSPWED